MYNSGKHRVHQRPGFAIPEDGGAGRKIRDFEMGNPR
jgi:hypothetical protein